MPDDETLNQMIARREEEFDLFMVMLQKSMETNASFPPHCLLLNARCLGPVCPGQISFVKPEPFPSVQRLQTSWI